VQRVGQAPRERVRPVAAVLVAGSGGAAATQQARASTDPGHAAAIAEYVQGQISTGQFPHLSKLARDPAAQTIAAPGSLDRRFERGLQALLNGAAAD
jgi:Tetracyclin repressor-like, C-terminal domain